MKKEENSDNDVAMGNYERQLQVDKHDLDNAISIQADMFWRVGEAAALARSNRDEAKDKLKQVDAELAARLRREGEEAGSRYTEKGLADAVIVHKEHRIAARKLREAQLNADKWDALTEAWKQRNYALGELASLWAAGYYQKDSARAAQGRVYDRQAEDARSRMSHKRRALQE